MSLNHLAYVALRHLYTASIFGFGGAVLGSRINLKHNPNTDLAGNPIQNDKSLSDVIYTVAVAALYVGSSLGKAAGAAWIPNHKRWCIIKPAAEMVLELLITTFFGYMTMAVSENLQQAKKK